VECERCWNATRGQWGVSLLGFLVIKGRVESNGASLRLESQTLEKGKKQTGGKQRKLRKQAEATLTVPLQGIM